MRSFRALMVAAALAACSKAPPQAPAVPPSPYPSPTDVTASLTGIVVVGDGWRLDANPFYGMGMVEHGVSTFSSSERLITGGTGAAFRYLASDVSVGVTRMDCVDGGVRYPLSATIDRPGKPQLSGCGFEQWDGRARAAVRIADACAPVGPDAQRITLFQVSGDGTMLVRLRGANGGVDCRVINGQLIKSPRDTTLRLGGEGELDLIRAPAPTPADPCIASNISTYVEFNLVGWLLQKDNMCRTQPMLP
jgi:hypothetical protein